MTTVSWLQVAWMELGPWPSGVGDELSDPGCESSVGFGRVGEQQLADFRSIPPGSSTLSVGGRSIGSQATPSIDSQVPEAPLGDPAELGRRRRRTQGASTFSHPRPSTEVQVPREPSAAAMAMKMRSPFPTRCEALMAGASSVLQAARARLRA
jgi:hypothetical protein